jgi:hypothetical protein
MFLTDIDIYKTNKYKNTVEEQHLLLIELEQNRYLRNYWENIRDLFCLKLPKKFNFLDISKFNIQLGSFEGEKFTRSREGGIATYKRVDFDFQQFEKLSDLDKNLASVRYVRESLLDVCEIHNTEGSFVELFNSICDEIVEDAFKITRIFSKTTKWNKSRNVRAVTLMHHKVGGIDVSVEFLNKAGDPIYRELVVENQFWEYIYFDIWQGYWNDSTFIIENKNGNEVKALTLPG